MATTRAGALVALGVMAATAIACSGGGSAAPDAGGGGGGGGSGGSNDAADDIVGALDTGSDLPDVPADFSADGQAACPTAAGALAPVEAALLIDDFTGTGPLEGRRVTRPAFTVRQLFGGSENAQFDVPPGINGTCGAASPGAAHIAGMPADAGATFAIIFSSGAAGAANYYDASAFRGITFRAAVGDARSSRVFPLRAGVADSTWSYTADVTVDGTAWKQIDVLWTDLDKSKAPLAPPFNPARLNQLVLSLTSGAAVDIFLDDLAFLR